jgi:purine nucleosidase
VSDRIPVLLDTDIGSDIDDALALAYLLEEGRCELAGITTVTGDTTKRAALAQMLCDIAGQPAIPVHCGTSTTLRRPGQPDVPQFDAVSHLAHRIDWPHDTAIPFMAETIRERPGEIVLLSIGPLTNVARLFSEFPETSSLLRGWFAMSGYFSDAAGRGSWNVICDPESAAIAFPHRYLVASTSVKT